MKAITKITLLLTLATLTLVVAAPAHAQVDWHQEFLNSSILSGETIITYPNGTSYVSMSGSRNSGVNWLGKGSYELDNGSYLIGSDGEPTDCSEQPAECLEQLEEAAHSEPTTEAQSHTGDDAETEAVLLTRFELQADESIRYASEGGLRGINGVRPLDTWFTKRRTGR